MAEPTSRLMRICDILRRKSLVKCIPNIDKLLEKGRVFFGTAVQRIALEIDGSYISDDDVLQTCAEEGFTFMLLQQGEEWSPLNNYVEMDNVPIPTSNNETDKQVIEPEQQEMPTLDHHNECEPNAKVDIYFEETENTEPVNECKSVDSAEETLIAVDLKRKHVDDETTTPLKKPLISPSVKPGKSSDIDVPSMFKLAKFEVDWEKIPEELKALLRSDVRSSLALTDLTRLIDHVVSQMRSITTKIPISMFRQTAAKITSKYVILLDTDDDGMLIGTGSEGIAEKLRSHNNYLNRPHKTGKYGVKPKSDKRSSRNCIVGINESYYLSGASHCSKDNLLQLLRNQSDTLNEEFYEETACYIRYKLDNSESLVKLMTEMPILQKRELLQHHFYKATGQKAEQFIVNFKSKREKLIQVSLTFRDEKLHLPSSASDMQIFRGIAAMLKETLSDMVFEFELGTTLDTVEIAAAFPTLAVFDTEKGKIFYVHAENTFLTNGCNDYIQAFQELMMIYFVYFMQYPHKLSKTLEFFQLYFLKIQPGKGTKSTATIVGKQQRQVRTLITKIAKLSDPTNQKEKGE